MSKSDFFVFSHELMANIDNSVKDTSHHHISGAQIPFKDVFVGAGFQLPVKKTLVKDFGESGSYFME